MRVQWSAIVPALAIAGLIVRLAERCGKAIK